MSEEHMDEISSMTDHELTASIRVVSRQIAAPIFVGDKEERRDVLKHLQDEFARRGN